MTSLQMWDNDLAPDSASAVLPIQFYPDRREGGEKSLLRAVLDDALLCLVRNSRIDTSRGRRLVQEDLDWLNDSRDDYPTSFVSICQALDLDASYIRQGIKASLARRLAPDPEHILRRCHAVQVRGTDTDSERWRTKKLREHNESWAESEAI